MVDDRTMKIGIEAAYEAALESFRNGGVPVGSSLVLDGAVIASGYNKRARGSNVLHGETDCIENAGHGHDFGKAVLFTTLSPCSMCAGAILLFRIPTVVILDDENTDDFDTNEAFLDSRGVEVIVNRHAPSIELNRKFQHDPKTRPLWLGDVGSIS